MNISIRQLKKNTIFKCVIFNSRSLSCYFSHLRFFLKKYLRRKIQTFKTFFRWKAISLAKSNIKKNILLWICPQKCVYRLVFAVCCFDWCVYNPITRLPSNDGTASKGKQQTSEPVHILKRSFARTVSVVRALSPSVINLLCFGVVVLNRNTFPVSWIGNSAFKSDITHDFRVQTY